MKPKRSPEPPAHATPLSPTEEEILKTVHTYRYMTALDVVYSLFSPKSVTHVRSILSTLSGGLDHQERQLLYRFPLPTAQKGNRERIYTLGAAGREAMKSVGLPSEWYYRPSKTGRLSHSHLTHQLLVTRFVTAACWWSKASPEYTLAEVRLSFEIEQGLHTRTAAVVIPDAWLLFERLSDGARFPVLVEVDRGSEYQERFKTHVRGRLEFIRSGDYTRLFHTPAVIIAYATTGQIAEYAQSRRASMAAWTMDMLTELKMERWAGLFRVASVEYKTLYQDATTLFEAPVWYRPDSPTPMPLLGS
jgi:Replication-relaxation